MFDCIINEKLLVKVTYHFYLTNGVNVSLSSSKLGKYW